MVYILKIVLFLRLLSQLFKVGHPSPQFPVNWISRVLFITPAIFISLSMTFNYLFFDLSFPLPLSIFIFTLIFFTTLTTSLSSLLKTYPSYLNLFSNCVFIFMYLFLILSSYYNIKLKSSYL